MQKHINLKTEQDIKLEQKYLAYIINESKTFTFDEKISMLTLLSVSPELEWVKSLMRERGLRW
jgi:hypothetical protein